VGGEGAGGAVIGKQKSVIRSHNLIMKATIGRIVIYTLTEEDVEQIMRRRTTGPAIAERIAEGKWPLGAQAHIGNSVHIGNQFPAVVVRTWDNDPNLVNLRVMLDGTDDFWATSRVQEDPAGPHGQPGTWHWPTREA
jgi:hypothetical protein